jgi:hypothetical protein
LPAASIQSLRSIFLHGAEQLLHFLTRGRFTQLRPRPFQRLAKSVSIERLEQVIECVVFKRSQGIAVIGSDKNDRGHLFRTDGLDHTETIQHGHLHIQKHEIGSLGADAGDRVTAVGAFGDHFHVRLVLEQLSQALARQRLIIHN